MKSDAGSSSTGSSLTRLWSTGNVKKTHVERLVKNHFCNTFYTNTSACLTLTVTSVEECYSLTNIFWIHKSSSQEICIVLYRKLIEISISTDCYYIYIYILQSNYWRCTYLQSFQAGGIKIWINLHGNMLTYRIYRAFKLEA